MKADIVIPNLEIDSSVLFQPGQVGLQAQAVKGESDKVVQFVRVFNASKLIVEGHTDSDGDGYNDGYEVFRGYNPAGPGKLE